MYQEFFGLKEPPFNLTPDPRFLYLSGRHREALAALVYGIRERKGFIAITGEIGSGKTTLCRAFLKDLDHDTTNVALVLNSYLNDLELLQTINQELGIPADSTSKKELIDALNRFLLDENAKGKTTILIVDEAQNLGPQVLEQIRMLSNLETETSKLIQIVLIGQPELADLLNLPELEQLNQRIMVRFHVTPLERGEVYHYVRHRLNVAGAKINVSLTPAAQNRLYHFSRGIPRKINLLCDRALLSAFVAGRFEVDAAMIASAERELRSLGSVSKRGPNRILASSWFRVGAGAAALTTALIFCFWIGLKMGRPGAEAPPFPTSGLGAPGLALPPVATPTPTPAPLPTPEPAIAPLPGLADLPLLTTATLPAQWTWDSNNVARVQDPDYAGAAALLTVARLWLYVFPLEPFADLDKRDILSLNIPRIFRRPGLDLGSFETDTDLRNLLVMDMPLALLLDDPSGRVSPVVTLARVTDDLAQIADPRLGLVELGLPTLEALYRKAVVVFPDADRLSSLQAGDESSAVGPLREFFIQEGVWKGVGKGDVMDEEMAEAVRLFQEKCGLVGTGRLDGPTAAMIARDRSSWRPRLR